MHRSIKKKQLDANIIRGVYVDIVYQKRVQGTAVVMWSEGHTVSWPQVPSTALHVVGVGGTTKGNATLTAVDDKRMALQTASQ